MVIKFAHLSGDVLFYLLLFSRFNVRQYPIFYQKLINPISFIMLRMIGYRMKKMLVG